jgi:hypothetical protein
MTGGRSSGTCWTHSPGWDLSGDVLAALVKSEGLDLGRVSKSFGNDVLLALSCREAGVVLVTDNGRDFERIARVARFDFTDPWPTPARA